MSTRSEKIIYWTPRITSIVLIAFLTMFSFDVFSEGYTFWETLLALLMHNIPSLVLTVVLILAWRFELVGTVVFGCAALFYMFVSRNAEDQLLLALAYSLILAGPALLISLLFYLGWRNKKKLTE